MPPHTSRRAMIKIIIITTIAMCWCGYRTLGILLHFPMGSSMAGPQKKKTNKQTKN